MIFMFTLCHANIPEYAQTALCAVSETTEAKPLASLKVSQNKSEMLHRHRVPHSVHMNVLRVGQETN